MFVKDPKWRTFEVSEQKRIETEASSETKFMPMTKDMLVRHYGGGKKGLKAAAGIIARKCRLRPQDVMLNPDDPDNLEIATFKCWYGIEFIEKNSKKTIF